MDPSRIKKESEAFDAKQLPRLARMLGHWIASAPARHSSPAKLEEFRRTVDVYRRQVGDPFVVGYLDALLEVAAASQRELESKEPPQTEEKLQGKE